MTVPTSEEWREWERRARADPGDLEALTRAIACRRRAGLEVPPDLLEREVRPGCSFSSVLELEVLVVQPDGSVELVGRSGPSTTEPLAVPSHQVLVVEGGVKAPLEQVLVEARRNDATGLSLVRSDRRRSPGLPSIAGESQLEWLRLTGWRAPLDEALPSLRSLEALRYLELAYSDLGRHPLARLAELPSLRELRLDPPESVELADLEAFARLPRLERLRLCAVFEPREVAGAIDRLARLRALTELHLDLVGTFLPAADFEPLGSLERLRALSVTECWITTEQLRGIARLTGLERLALDARAQGLDALAGSRALRSLSLVQPGPSCSFRPDDDEARWSPATATVADHALAELDQVVELSLPKGDHDLGTILSGAHRVRRLRVDEVGLQGLKTVEAVLAHGQLDELALGDVALGDEVLPVLARLPGLRALDVALRSAPSRATVASLGALGLESLTIGPVDDDVVSALATFTTLRRLRLTTGTSPGRPGRLTAARLRELAALPALERLDVTGLGVRRMALKGVQVRVVGGS